MGYKKDDPCLQKAHEDERLFVLMARDPQAPRVVLDWIKASFDDQPDYKLREAFECAIEMKNRRTEFEIRKKLNHEFGWIFVQKELPPEGSECKVLFSDYTEGVLTYWSHEEGFDAQTEPHHIEVIAFKDPVRAR